MAARAADHFGSFAVELEVATDILRGIPGDVRGDQPDVLPGSEADHALREVSTVRAHSGQLLLPLHAI